MNKLCWYIKLCLVELEIVCIWCWKFLGIDVWIVEKNLENFIILYEIFISEDFDDKIVCEIKNFWFYL